MKPLHNDVFRLIALRGARAKFAVDPGADNPDGDVVRLLAGIEVEPQKPNSEIPRLIESVPVLSETELEALAVTGFAKALHRSTPSDATALAEVTWAKAKEEEEGNFTLRHFATDPQLSHEYRKLTDSWLRLQLTAPDDPRIGRHEMAIRAAALAHRFATAHAELAEPGGISRVLRAPVMKPSSWTEAGRRDSAVLVQHGQTLAATQRPDTSALSQSVAKARQEFAALAKKAELSEVVAAKVHRRYFEWKSAEHATLPDDAIGFSVPGLAGKIVAFVAGTVRQPGVAMPSPPLPLTQGFYTSLNVNLGVSENQLLQDALGTSRPTAVDNVLAALDPGQLLAEANTLCRQIKIWEDQESEQLPDAPQPPQQGVRPLVRSIGWGDLVVVRERLIGYDAREVAHIENVMSGEEKRRSHERSRTVETLTETEVVRDSESERDLQTTDRFELQEQTQSVLEERFTLDARLNTSGRYGLTTVETSLQAGLQASSSESRSSAQTLAQEVVSRAVERTRESVRERRRQTITEQVRELNRHVLSNLPAQGQAGPPADVSGIYVWVEKLHEMELRQYGTRMLVEFHIPEPGLGLLDRGATRRTAPRKPAPFTIAPDAVEPSNYLCLTAAYGATDVRPPPALHINVGYSWASTPNEDDDSWGQDARADSIAIPAGYRPLAAHGVISAHPAAAEHFDVFLAVGGVTLVRRTGVTHAASVGEVAFDPAHAWPAGVPVVLRGAGHFDKTLVAKVVLRCERTAEALTTWKLRTWERLRDAHAALMLAYRAQVEEEALVAFATAPVERPAAENRRREAEELRRWAIQAMRLTSFDFADTVVQVGDYQEIDPVAGDLHARLVRFFEQAFEWDQASHFLYPYYWARRDSWMLRRDITDVDARHAEFLRAGAARFIVPVAPGSEDRVLHYLESEEPELERLDGPPNDQVVPPETSMPDLWLELLLEHRPDTALGSGTLTVRNGATNVEVNEDSDWQVGPRDLGRELFIDGERYTIAATGDDTFDLHEAFLGDDDDAAAYATGSVPYGPPWVVRIPTSLVVLAGRRGDLAPLGRP